MGKEEGIQAYVDGRFEDALEQFLLENTDPADDVELAYYMGLCYTRMDDYDTAQLYLNRVLEADFNLIRVYQSRMILSYIYAMTERFDSARYQLEQIIQEGFESPQVFASLGYNCWALGETDEAVEYYRKAIEIDSENVTSHNSLGYILADENVNLREAMTHCRRAVEINPENSNYLDSLGWTYYRMGNYKLAHQYLKRADSLDRENSAVKQHLSAVEKHLE
ncbi:MAG: tetratricopeptide repeat protein [Spirochaetales bacterium]|nr:tetratricopeptide repeat protein [Spirochaetales bacterium]